MTAQERGFLLLTSHLGDPQRKVLSAAQLRTLALRTRTMERPEEDRELTQDDLISLGYGRSEASHILALLDEESWLEEYLRAARRRGCTPVTKASPLYPVLIRQRLGLDAPGCLWAKGDLDILNTPAVSLVGSRDLGDENRLFAEAVGREAARNGMTLISGNARGADRSAQDACLAAGGRVISIVADDLSRHTPRKNQLLISEDDYNAPFTTQRALSRNRCIHTMGLMVFVAQSDLHKGGTWDGTSKNLRLCWSQVACFRDGSAGSRELAAQGAWLIGMEDLNCISELKKMI